VSTAPARRTRRERQAETRARLLEAAGSVFARRGLEGASLDEIAAEAGFTKGALYANFASKEDLFLAMLDERFSTRLDEIERAMSLGEDPDDTARRAAADFTSYLAADPEWQRLFFEFAAHAARHEDFRRELVARYRALRERIGTVLASHAETLGIQPPVPPEALATMCFAMANGWALERLLEPEAAPDELYAGMLALFFTGVRAASSDSVPPG
jgi:AcrR family transcriptional regulator